MFYDCSVIIQKHDIMRVFFKSLNKGQQKQGENVRHKDSDAASLAWLMHLTEKNLRRGHLYEYEDTFSEVLTSGLSLCWLPAGSAWACFIRRLHVTIKLRSKNSDLWDHRWAIHATQLLYYTHWPFKFTLPRFPFVMEIPIIAAATSISHFFGCSD